MRKLTVELKVKEELLEMLDFLLEKVESMELIELIKIDFDQGVKMGIAALNMKDGYTIDDINIPEYVDMLTVLNKQGNRYVVVSKVQFFKQFSSMAKQFDIDIIWDTPSIFKKDTMLMSVTGSEENLKKFLEIIKNLGEVTKISFQIATFDERTILSCLTEKQREVMIAAKKHGYYKYPREITSQQLSDKIGLSKPTVIQHLRKAEERLLSNLLAGY
ncbi:MAG: helix-turn-helix domain-containing protein [Candidatus Thermoplasmatota archaeon]|nr:helix-turn-helix domain-containing protein [Candidatus Thermoplasmatota archaeon]